MKCYQNDNLLRVNVTRDGPNYAYFCKKEISKKCRGNAKTVSKALVPPEVYKVLRVFMSRCYVTGIPSIFTIPKLSYLGEHSEVSQAWSLHAC